MQGGGGLVAPRGQGDTGVQQGVGDVVQGGGVLAEEELLEHKPDRRRAQRRQLPVRQARDVQASDPHPAGGGPGQRSGPVQQPVLARPRRAPPPDQPPSPPPAAPPPFPGWACGASSATASVSGTLPVVISTVTGAWFSPPAARG